MDTNDFSLAVRRLAQYRPFDDGGADLTLALQRIAYAAALVEGGTFASLRAAQSGIRDLWGVEVEIEELREIVAAGERANTCARTNGGFSLTAETLEGLQRLAAESEETERTAFAEWEASIAAEHPELGPDDFVALREDLKRWLNVLIARHGIEASLLLYPENPRAAQFFEVLEQTGPEVLPTRDGRVGEVRESAFLSFVRVQTPARRTYLAGLLNTSFHLSVVTLDPAAGDILKEQLRGHRIYLDTNFIYALIGLAGVQAATLAVSAARLLELSSEMGFELAVTSWTLNELRTSLRAQERKLSRAPLPRRELAELMALKDGESDITRAYWLKYRDTGERPSDFFEYYEHVETLLETYNVCTKNDACPTVERDEAMINEYLSLLDRFTGPDKEDVIKLHDVKHRLLIERLRGEGNVKFSNARYWFLTRDTRLPRYALVRPDGSRVQLPFCVAPAAWLQVIRAFSPRTEDFDESLVDLMSTPYLRHVRTPSADPAVVEAVVARVDRYAGATPKLAAEVLMDTALTTRIADSRDDKLDEVIENAFIIKAQELEQLAAEAAVRSTEEAEARKRAEQTADERRKALEQQQSETESARAEAKRLVDAQEEREREHQAELERVRQEAELAAAKLAQQQADAEQKQKELEDEAAAERTRRQDLERTVRRVLAVFAAGGAAVLTVLPFSQDWSNAYTILSLSGTCGCLFLAGVVAFGFRGAWKVLEGLAVVLSIIGFICFLVLLRHHK